MVGEPFLDPQLWLHSVFSVKAVNRGGVFRRSVRDIDRIAGRERFLAEVKRRGFHAVRNADQIVVFCNNDPIEPLC